MPSGEAQTIRERLDGARDAGRCALIPYITLGYPTLEISLALLESIEALGADVVEVGIPFSDPVADGPTIQHTIDLALKQGVHLSSCLEALSRVPSSAPRLLFSYWNPLLRMGLENLMARLSGTCVAGALVTDLVPEEAGPWLEWTDKSSIERCFLVTATSNQERLRRAVECTTGFVYCVSTLGVTGARTEVDPRARETVERVRSLSDLPIAVGFGVSSPDDVRRIRQYADGVVVGSALLRAVGDEADLGAAVARAEDFLGPLLEASR